MRRRELSGGFCSGRVEPLESRGATLLIWVCEKRILWVAKREEDCMHHGRLVTVVGSVLAIIGLGLKSASSTGEALLPNLSAAIPTFPAGFDPAFTALWNENAPAAGIFVIALAAVVGVSLMPSIKEALSRMNALVVTVLGVVMMVIGGIALTRAIDDAAALTRGFAEAAAAGLIPAAHTVSAGWGWYLLAIGGVFAAIGGVLQLMSRPGENALSD